MDFPRGKGNSNHGVSMLRSVKETAGELAVGRDSVVRLIESGELPAVEFPKMGGKGKNRKRMVEDDEIKRFKERRATKRKLDRFFQ
jgi:excisionase family DNA binding protein